MALLHNIKGDFEVDIDFGKRERLLKQTMLLDHYKKTSRRMGLGISLDTACKDQLQNSYRKQYF